MTPLPPMAFAQAGNRYPYPIGVEDLLFGVIHQTAKAKSFPSKSEGKATLRLTQLGRRHPRHYTEV